MMPSWSVVHTKVGRSDQACATLAKNGFDVFYPQCRLRAGDPLQALFPRYLFADIAGHYGAIARINNSKGVECVVQFGGCLPLVADKDIRELREMTTTGIVLKEIRDRVISKGERYRLTDGPLVDRIALIAADATKDGRAEILFQIFGGAQRTTVSVDWLGEKVS